MKCNFLKQRNNILALTAYTLLFTCHLHAMNPQAKALTCLLNACASSQENTNAAKRALLDCPDIINEPASYQLDLSPTSKRVFPVDNLSGYTALHLATAHNHQETVRLLLKAKAKIDQENYAKETSLHIAASKGLYILSSLLLKNNASVSARNSHNYTPLHEAALHGHLAVAQLLIEHNALVAQQKPYETTPLHLACLRGYAPVVEVLIAHNAAIDAEDMRRHTPMSNAIQSGNAATVKTLLLAGAPCPDAGAIASEAISNTILEFRASQVQKPDMPAHAIAEEKKD